MIVIQALPTVPILCEYVQIHSRAWDERLSELAWCWTKVQQLHSLAIMQSDDENYSSIRYIITTNHISFGMRNSICSNNHQCKYTSKFCESNCNLASFWMSHAEVFLQPDVQIERKNETVALQAINHRPQHYQRVLTVFLNA